MSSHILDFKCELIYPLILLSILCKSLKTNLKKLTWESSYLETCLRFAYELKVVWVRLFWIFERLLQQFQYFQLLPFKKVNLLMFLGVLIVFLFKEVSCRFWISSSSWTPLILHWVPVIAVEPVKKECAVFACELEVVPTIQSNLCM